MRAASLLAWALGAGLFLFHGTLGQYVTGLALCLLGYVLWEPRQNAPGRPLRHDQ